MPAIDRLKKLSHVIDALPAANASPSTTVIDDQPIQLAREMTAALAAELAKHRTTDFVPLAPFDPEALQHKPIDEITFFDLERLALNDPGASADKWNEMTDTATCDIASGLDAARSLEMMGHNAWRRATFKAMRKLLRDAWSPRQPLESMLIDQIAQYELLRRQWLGVFSLRSRDPETMLTLRGPLDDERPQRSLSAAQATKEALFMVERLQRLTHQAIRNLAMLRGKNPAIFIRQIAQLNMANGPQANVQSNEVPNAL